MHKYSIFGQFKNKLAITHTIGIKLDNIDAMAVDCHHNLSVW